MTLRSARDVASRYTRGTNFISNLEEKETKQIDEVLFHLERIDDFQILSKSVKSQIRRALKLQFEFACALEYSNDNTRS